MSERLLTRMTQAAKIYGLYGRNKEADLLREARAEIMRLRVRNSELKESLGYVVNDYINFDDGHLTEAIFKEAAKLIKKEVMDRGFLNLS